MIKSSFRLCMLWKPRSCASSTAPARISESKMFVPSVMITHLE